MQGVNSSLYVYQEVLEGCNELVTAEEYVSLGEVVPSSHCSAHCWAWYVNCATLPCCPANTGTAHS